MSEATVLNLSELRMKNELKEQETQIKAYLSSLKQEDLQYEANYLMNKIQIGTEIDQAALLKSALLMDELAKRVSGNTMSDSISAFAKNIRTQMNDSSDLETIH